MSEPFSAKEEEIKSKLSKLMSTVREKSAALDNLEVAIARKESALTLAQQSRRPPSTALQGAASLAAVRFEIQKAEEERRDCEVRIPVLEEAIRDVKSDGVELVKSVQFVFATADQCLFELSEHHCTLEDAQVSLRERHAMSQAELQSVEAEFHTLLLGACEQNEQTQLAFQKHLTETMQKENRNTEAKINALLQQGGRA